MIVSIVSNRGGAGKSTLAVHAAAWLLNRGLRVACVDADAGGTGTRWLARAAPRIPVYAFLHAADLLDQLPRLLDRFDAVVADGPAALAAETAALVSVADVVLLPVNATMDGVHAAFRTARLVRGVQQHPKRAGLPLAFIVLNRLHNRARLARLAAEATIRLGLPVAATAVEHRPALAWALAGCTVLWQMKDGAEQAAAELSALFDEVLDVDRVRQARVRASRVQPPAEATRTLGRPLDAVRLQGQPRAAGPAGGAGEPRPAGNGLPAAVDAKL